MAFHPAICFRFLSPISRSLPLFQLTATLRCVRPFQPLNSNRTPPSLPGRWSPLWRLFVYMAACSGVFMPFLGSGFILCVRLGFWLGTHLPLNMYFGATRFRLSRVINQPLNMRDWTLGLTVVIVHCGCARMHLISIYITCSQPWLRQTCTLFPWIISYLTYPCVLPLLPPSVLWSRVSQSANAMKCSLRKIPVHD